MKLIFKYSSAKRKAPIALTRHAKQRLRRVLCTEKEAIADIRRHFWSIKQERGGDKMRVKGDLAEYILSETFQVITMLKIMNRKQRKSNTKGKYLGIQWTNLSRKQLNDLVQKSIS